jgi:sortase A
MSMVTPCHTFVYTVTGHSIVKAGSPVFQTVHGRLVLVTCYPLNALYLTPNRYLVEATLNAVTNAGQVTDPNPTSGAAPPPSVPAPPALLAQGLDLAHNETPLGVLTFSGTPTAAWTQSPAPLQAEAVVLELYFAALRSAEQDQAGWWMALAPQVPFAATGDLHGVSTPQTVRPLQPSLDMEGTTLTGATVSTSLRVPAGTFSVTMTASVVNGQLEMTGFSMQPS